LKNIIQSILHSHSIPACPHADLCGQSGRAWLVKQVLPDEEWLAIERHLRFVKWTRGMGRTRDRHTNMVPLDHQPSAWSRKGGSARRRLIWGKSR
jgi:hypothetical protein